MTKTTLLAILQQSEYDLEQLKLWASLHHGEDLTIEPAEWTPKLKVIKTISSLLFFLPPLTGIAIALNLFTPFENFLRWIIYTRAGFKLWWLRLRGLKVVAIAGSYAKTSTKHILNHTFSAQLHTLMTPKSYNTKLGIAQVILKELTSQHQLFLVEFGEYHPQDIPQLTAFIKPDWGILTPIGHQHLSVIGGFDNLVKTFNVFTNYFKKHPDRLIVAEQNKSLISPLQSPLYGTQASSHYRVINTHITRAGTEFEILDQVDHQTHQLFMPLFGEHQAVNATTAYWLAKKVGLAAADVSKRLRAVPYIYRRHEPTFAEHNVLILDNSYNTNADSIIESLKLVNQLTPSRRLIITLGFTELGDEAQARHFELGQLLAREVDVVGLIKAPWTQAIIDGYTSAGGDQKMLKVGDTQEAALAQVQSFIIPDSVILFEGGYQEVYV